MSLNIEIVPAFEDNYIFLLECKETGELAVVDPGSAEAVIKALKGREISKILNTHHHDDHIGGNSELVKEFGCEVHGSSYDEDRIPEITHTHLDGDYVRVGHQEAKILEIPGHTLGHIAYYFEDAGVVFVGDTLFVGGCGRVFEGTMSQMFNSLVDLSSLPDDTKIYCAHEYTQSNLTFSLNYSKNKVYKDRMHEVERVRAEHLPTVPTTIGEEKRSNIFLQAKTSEEFAKIRDAKDRF